MCIAKAATIATTNALSLVILVALIFHASFQGLTVILAIAGDIIVIGFGSLEVAEQLFGYGFIIN
jgi:hypothetical protein